MLKSLIFSFTLVGTFVGAGFATGQEMVSFFLLRNPDTPIYFIISALILFIALKLGADIKTSGDTRSFYTKLFGKTLGSVMFIVSVISLFICYGASAAGMGSIFYESFSLPYLSGALILSAISFTAAAKGIRGINILNSILTPMIIISVIILGLIAALSPSAELISFKKNHSNSLVYALLYAGYNIFPLIPITIKKKKATLSIILAFIFTSLCGVILFFALGEHLNISLSSSVPFQAIIKSISKTLGNLYAPVICMALVTTGASCLYGFISYMEQSFKKTPLYIICFIATMLFLLFGFKTTVRVVYPISGIFGVILIVRILLYRIS